MKKLYTKINELWFRYKQWGESSLIGSVTVSAINIGIIMVLFLVFFYALGIFDPLKERDLFTGDYDVSSESCSIAGIELHGTLLTYIPNHSENDSFFDYNVVASQDIVWAIRQANEDEEIKGIIIEVDSFGGSPIGGEEISIAIENSEKPVVAFIREVGASSAYWAISGADKIFASKNSNVGSIGVTSSYLSNVNKNTKDGYVYEQISVGKYKDSGSPDKPLTQEERDLFMRDNLIIYQNFIEAISKNRNIPIEKVKSFSDGATVLGVKAKELNLIDAMGGIYEVEQYLEEITGEKPGICWQ